MHADQVSQFVSTLAKVAYYQHLPIDELATELRRQFVLVVLEKNKYNETRTAIELQMHRNSLLRQMRRMGIDAASFRRQIRLKRRAARLAEAGWAEK